MLFGRKGTGPECSEDLYFVCDEQVFIGVGTELGQYRAGGFDAIKGHIGLSNLYHRLKLIYGDSIYMSISNVDEGGAMAEVILPARKPVKPSDGGEDL